MEETIYHQSACAVCGKNPALVDVEKNCSMCAGWARRFQVIQRIMQGGTR